MSPSLSDILEYLSDLFADGKSYSLINIHRSMLSSTVQPIDGVPVGQLPSVRQLLRACFNRNPPRPRYSFTWDVNVVLAYLSSLGPSEDLSHDMLSRKLVVLIALSTLLRISEISTILFTSVVISDSNASFSLGRPRKAQHSGALQTIKISKLEDRLLCPVHCLAIYKYSTDVLRNVDNSDHLLMGLQHPFRPVSSSTVGHWIKWILGRAGVAPSFTAHSTRSAAASCASLSGVSVDSILRLGNWSSESTFSRFYSRTPVPPTDLGGSVLTRPL